MTSYQAVQARTGGCHTRIYPWLTYLLTY